jgi:hypothetical protein
MSKEGGKHCEKEEYEGARGMRGGKKGIRLRIRAKRWESGKREKEER